MKKMLIISLLSVLVVSQGTALAVLQDVLVQQIQDESALKAAIAANNSNEVQRLLQKSTIITQEDKDEVQRLPQKPTAITQEDKNTVLSNKILTEAKTGIQLALGLGAAGAFFLLVAFLLSREGVSIIE